MTDKELADRLVEIGILRDCNNYADGYYGLPGEAAMNPFKGSNLWRVAGAVMERIAKPEKGESMPRTIIEEGLEALSDDWLAKTAGLRYRTRRT